MERITRNPAVGQKTHTGNFELIKKIENLSQFAEVANNQKSIFWRFKVMPCAFFLSWQFRCIQNDIKNGYFYEVQKVEENK